MYSAAELRARYNNLMKTVPSRNPVHVYCDGSVSDNGRAGCGALVLDCSRDTVCEHEYSMRLSDHISSTLAELQALKLGLSKVLSCNKNVYVFVDSRVALDSLNSGSPVYQGLTAHCKNMIHAIESTGHTVQFYWVPSHAGIAYNDRVDQIAKRATEKENIEISCSLSLHQIRSIIKEKQQDVAMETCVEKYETRATFRHYHKIHA